MENPAAPRRTLRFVTWNIHKGIGGVDRRYRPERIVEVLRHAEADLVFLQEVDEGARRSRRDRQVDLIGDALGLAHRVYHPNHFLREGRYGNAILSRLPLDHSEHIDLTVPLKKRRGASHARLTLRDGGSSVRLWLFNVHLGLAGYERRKQLVRLLDWQRRKKRRGRVGVVIGGDFNDVWGRLGKHVLEPAGYRGTSTRILTFPAFRPVRPLDRVFVHGPIQVEHAHRSRLKLAREASDHQPLVADLLI